MFARHYRRHLSAYAHGELSPAEAARVAAHLDACAACRTEFFRVCSGTPCFTGGVSVHSQPASSGLARL